MLCPHDSEALEESMKRFECVLERQAAVGECPRWDERLQRLWWVDILAPALHCYDPESGEDMSIEMPEHIGSFALTEDGGFVAAMRSGIWLLDWAGRPLRQLCPNPGDVKTTRFNDGRCDAHGRFWVGTIDETRVSNAAALYRLDGEQLIRIEDGLLNSNGLAFSPDGRWLYHSDTPRFSIYRRSYDATTGIAGEREPWVSFGPSETGQRRPDGAAVDAEGYYWSALYDAGRVVRISPAGKIVAEYELAARCPTMCAFGGPDLRTLYVTTARHGRSAAELEALPLSGGVFAMKTDVPGMIEPRCTLRTT